MNILFIVNPAAGNWKAKKEWANIDNLLKETIKDYQVEFTEYPGHATEIAKKAAAEGYETIVSCGGDGTLNEVINGIVDSEVKCALIPLGTGSDFGKTIGVRTVSDSIKVLSGSKSSKVDTASVTFDDTGKSRFFMNVLEIGFGAEVMKYVNSHEKFGRFSFIIGVLSVLRKLKKFKIGTENNGNSEIDTIEVIVANGRYFGGGMLASPSSSIGDGVLDVHVLRPVSRLTTILRLRNLMNGTYIEKGFSLESKTKNIHFKEKGMLVEMDGEVVGETPVKISIKEGSVNFLVP